MNGDIMDIMMLKTIRFYLLYYNKKTFQLEEQRIEETDEEKCFLYDNTGKDITNTLTGQDVINQYKHES